MGKTKQMEVMNHVWLHVGNHSASHVIRFVGVHRWRLGEGGGGEAWGADERERERERGRVRERGGV